MSIQHIQNIRSLAPTHRCHPFALDFIIAAASVSNFMNAYHRKPVTTFGPTFSRGFAEYPTCSIAGKASQKTIDFVPEDVLQGVFVNNVRTIPISYLEQTTFSQIEGVGTMALAETIEGFAQTMFTRYWECNLQQMEQVHGKRRSGGWPPVLHFSAIVRDAMSHGGVLKVFPNVAPATYFGITYTPDQNGKRIIHTDLTSADLFLLMLDLDAIF